MSAQPRLRSACASLQSDQNLLCPHLETLHPCEDSYQMANVINPCHAK